jgi:hypothetical protein
MMNTPTPTLDSLDDLLALARAEPDPCRLLTVIVKADPVHQNVNGKEEAMDEGVLQPLMVRDWPVTGDLSMESIVAAADEVTSDWRFLMTAILPGANGTAPTPDECTPHLEHMAKALTLGDGLGAFVFFDREGTPVQVATASA